MNTPKVLRLLGFTLLALSLIFSLTDTTGGISYPFDTDTDCGSLIFPGDDLKTEKTEFLGRVVDTDYKTKENEYCAGRRNNRRTLVIFSAVLGALVFSVGYLNFGSERSHTDRRPNDAHIGSARSGDQPNPNTSSYGMEGFRDSLHRSTSKEQPTNKIETNFCSSCGKAVEPDGSFCSSCGKKLK
jgi:hypothetical protein